MVIKGSIIAEQIDQFQNHDVHKLSSKMEYLEDNDWYAGFTKLANLERYAWIESRLFMSCGSAEYGEAIFYLPKSNPSNTFYDDYVALPFPKNSTLVGQFNKV